MSRSESESISFAVQANFCEENSYALGSDFLHSPNNLVESSNKYGFVFFCKGSTLFAVSIEQTETKYDGGESNQPFDPDFSFRVEFRDGDIHLLALSPTESFIAVMSGPIMSIFSVANLLITVRQLFLIFTTHFW